MFGHVIDPRTGVPVTRARSAVVIGPHSFPCDALSAALLVNRAEWLPALRMRFPAYDGEIA